MKNSRLNKSSKEQTIKRRIGKLKTFHQKRRLLKSKLYSFGSGNSTNFDASVKYNQNLSEQPITQAVNSNYSEKLQLVSPKQWWIHIWQGLVIDETSKHQKAMRQAIWLYLYLLMVANWKTGILYRKISTIIKETGFNQRTVQRWLKILREKGYIETCSTGRSLQISITKWRPINKRKTGKSAADNTAKRQ